MLKTFETIFDNNEIFYENVTSFITEAVRMRFSSEYGAACILSLIALEHFIRIICGIPEDDNRTLRNKLKSCLKLCSHDSDLIKMSDLMFKFGFAIRNRAAHQSQDISEFLCDYLIYLTNNLIKLIAKNSSLENEFEPVYPFEYVPAINLMTKELSEVYGANLDSFSKKPAL